LYLTVGGSFLALGSLFKKPTDKVRLLDEDEQKEADTSDNNHNDKGEYNMDKASIDVSPATEISPNEVSADNRTTIMMSPESQKIDLGSKVMSGDGDQYNTIVEKDEEGEFK